MLQIAPLLPVTLGLIAGILIDRDQQPVIWIYGSGFLAACGATFVRGLRQRAGFLIVFVAAACTGGAMHLARVRIVLPNGIERVATETGRIARVYGTVVSPPQRIPKADHAFSRWTYGGDRTAFLLDAESVEGDRGDIHVTGRLRVVVYEPLLNLRENERVELFGRLSTLHPPRNPGAFDWAGFHRLQGVMASMVCEHRQNVRVLEDQPGVTAAKLIAWFRATARGMLIDDLAAASPEEMSLLDALILGHRSPLDRALNNIFVRSGCMHFLAASGTNVAILISFVWFVARLLRQSRRRCAWLMIITALLYAALADPRPPILRATVMVLIFCLSYLLGRSAVHLNTISSAAALLLMLDPNMLFDVGFQLSFTAVLGVVFLAPALVNAVGAVRIAFERRVLHRVSPEEDRRIIWDTNTSRSFLGRASYRTGDIVLLALAVSVAAWLAGLPIVAGHFQRLQPWGAVASLLVYPLFSVVMILGFVKLVMAALSPTLGSLPGIPLQALDGLLLACVKKLAALPAASVDLPAIPAWLLILYGVGLMLFTAKFWSHRPRDETAENLPHWSHESRGQPPAWVGPAWMATLAACALGIGFWLWPKPRIDQLAMTVLAVGRGSATVIKLPDGRTVLYDAGTSYPWDIGRHTVVPFLRHRGISRVDRIYVSHANLDHFSGIPTVVDEVPAGPVVVNHFFEHHSRPKSPSRHLLDLLAERIHPIEIVEPRVPRWASAGVKFEVLWPPAASNPSLTTNDTSTVLRLTYADRSILLTGDIEENAQRALIEQGDLSADVLILPHHGSFETTLAPFLAAVAPRAVIRSSNQRTEGTAKELLETIGSIPFYNTADQGAIQVTLDADGIRVVPFLPPI